MTGDVGPLTCRVRIPGGGECDAPGGTCGIPAAVGVVTEPPPLYTPEGPGMGRCTTCKGTSWTAHFESDGCPYCGAKKNLHLQFFPVCSDHSTSHVAHVEAVSDHAEYAVITLAYGQRGGLS